MTPSQAPHWLGVGILAALGAILWAMFAVSPWWRPPADRGDDTGRG